MIKNFFTIAMRNLFRNKGFSFINISGLAIGMASAILILLWIQNEMSMDRFHAKENRLYIAANRDKFDGMLSAWVYTPKILGPTLKLEYANDIENVARVTDNNFLFTVGDKHLNAQGYFTDPSFLSMFSFPLLKGNAINALGSISSIVVTEKFANKLFGTTDAMGKVVRIDSTDNFTVTAVLKDLPNNTSFQFDYLLPWQYMKKIGYDDEYWGNNSIQTYILLKPGISHDAFDAKIKKGRKSVV